MFIWTISDVIGLAALALVSIFFGALFVLIKIQDWQLSHKRAASARMKEPQR